MNTFELAGGYWPHYSTSMSIQELESRVAQLSKPDLAAFNQWFENFMADSWDQQIETDIVRGKLDPLAKQADAQFEAGRCTPL
jgi:hypothetical protein